MTTFRLDTGKLLRDVDRARRAGAPDELSYRRIAKLIGAGSSSVFTRLRTGQTPDADTLLSLLMWLNPRASVADYATTGGGRQRRRGLRAVPEMADAAS